MSHFNGIALEQNFDYTFAGPWLYHLYGTTLYQVGLVSMQGMLEEMKNILEESRKTMMKTLLSD